MTAPHRILFWTDTRYPRKHIGRVKLYPKHAVTAVIEHLKSGGQEARQISPMKCLFCCADLGDHEMTDGQVAWPQNAHHYITAHQVWAPEHAWLAERLLLSRDGPPPRVAGHRERRRPGQGRGERVDTPAQAPVEQKMEPVGDNGMDMTALARDALSDWPSAAPSESSATMAVETEWMMSDDVLDAMVSSTLQERAAKRDQSERRSRASKQKPQSRRNNQRSRQNRKPSKLDNRRAMVEAVVDDVAATTALIPTNREESAPLDQYGTDMASAITQAYPKAFPALASRVVAAAAQVGAHPFDLANIIEFESGRSWSPAVQNPRSGATGLIQFYPGFTKQNIGVSVQKLARMSPLEQMQWVAYYLDKMRAGQPLDTPHKLAMAVFYPKAINWPSDQKFPASVTANNPGIYTPADYVALVQSVAKLPPSSQAPAFTPGGERGLLGDVVSWFSQVLGGGATTSTPQPPPASIPVPTPEQPAVAHWESDPSLTVRLVGPNGTAVGPGQIQPGGYQLDGWYNNTWVPLAPVQISAGHRYVVHVSNGRLLWTET